MDTGKAAGKAEIELKYQYQHVLSVGLGCFRVQKVELLHIQMQRCSMLMFYDAYIRMQLV